MTTTVQNERKPSISVKTRRSLALAFFAFIFIGANDGGLGVLLPSIRTHYHINTGTLSYIFLAGTVGYLLSSLNSGLLVEKLGMRRFLILGSVIYIVGAAVYISQPIFLIVLVGALLIGMAVASLDAGLNSYIASLPENTALLNYLHAFYGAGAWLGPIVASTLLAFQWSWSSVYLVWGAFALIVAIGLLTIFVEPLSLQKVQGKQENNILLATLRVRVVWLAAFFLFFYCGSEVSTGSWSYSFLLGDRHIIPLFAGWMISGYWLGLTLGRIFLGRLALRIGPVRVIQFCLLGITLGVLVVWLLPLVVASAVGLFIVGFSLGPIFPTTIALMSSLVPARILPSAVGFLASFANIGIALFSWSAGNLIQHSGFWSLWPLQIFLAVCMLFLWLFLQKRPASLRPV